MLTATRLQTEIKVEALSSIRPDGPFACPACKAEVILKKGRIVTHHFAHVPPVTCDYGTGETEEHRKAKTEIAASLRVAGAERVEIEKRLGPMIADVYYENENEEGVAVEVQISKLSMQQILDRTDKYRRRGVAVLWIVPWKVELEHQCYSPRQYEKFLHALNYGRVYYWVGGLVVYAVHFGTFYLWKESTDWGGGYSYASARYRTPKELDEQLDMLTDFRIRDIPQRKLGRYLLPQARIMLDTQPAWWKTNGTTP